MKLILAAAAVSAMSLMSTGVAEAAFASYDFESATVTGASVGNPAGTGSIDGTGDATFAAALASLGVTSSSLSSANGTTGQRGVYCNNADAVTAGQVCTPGGMNASVGQNTTITYGSKSFGIGNTGETWTLNFGGAGISSFQFAYNETEQVGFTVTAYALDGTTVLATNVVNTVGNASTKCQFVDTCATTIISSATAIGKITVLDRAASPALGDGLQVDNLVVNLNTTATPEPSTYLMIGSALAGFATFRRRRA